jgi:membrane protein implicated in regulation of membrane protease activity
MNVADFLEVSVKATGALALILSAMSAYQATRHIRRIARSQARQYERSDAAFYMVVSAICAAATYYFYRRAFSFAGWAIVCTILLLVIYAGYRANSRSWRQRQAAKNRPTKKDSPCSQA